MAKFRKGGQKEVPAISTGSMPDIIFMLIFFFMVTTSMRESSVSVSYKLPEASEIQKLEKKTLVSIYMGLDPKTTTTASNSNMNIQIQLNDKVYPYDFKNPRAALDQIIPFYETEKAQRPDSEKNLITTALKIHEGLKMGVVTDVKQELRKCGAFRIVYSTTKK